MFALAPWDKPMTFKEEKSALEARQKEKIFENFFLEVQAVLQKFGSGGSEGRLPTRWEVLLRSYSPHTDRSQLLPASCNVQPLLQVLMTSLGSVEMLEMQDYLEDECLTLEDLLLSAEPGTSCCACRGRRES